VCILQALIIRDWALLWTLSVGFELMELTFQHMLPNFNECWWDSWVLDVAVCNFIGALWGHSFLSALHAAPAFIICPPSSALHAASASIPCFQSLPAMLAQA
jgi:hypothetical protein